MTQSCSESNTVPAGRGKILGAALSPAGLALLFTTGVFVVSYFYHPADVPRFSLCPFRALFGLDCPGCGLTRSFCALAKGEWSHAVRMHPLGPLFFSLFVYWWTYSLLRVGGATRLADRLAAPFARRPVITGFGLGVLLVWAVRLVGI